MYDTIMNMMNDTINGRYCVTEPHKLKKSKPKSKRPTNGFHRFRKDWIEPVLIALVLAGIIRSFIIQPFKIPSGSMEDTLLVGDQLMAAKFTYGLRIPFGNSFIVRWSDPKPGDVIVFQYPDDPSIDYIKRCVAVAGQTVEVRDKHVYVDGALIHDPPKSKHTKATILHRDISNRDNYGPVTVPKGNMFMMGDNRDNSHDSRFWGYVPYEHIKGKAFIIWWSWDSDASWYDPIHLVRWGRIFDIIR